MAKDEGVNMPEDLGAGWEEIVLQSTKTMSPLANSSAQHLEVNKLCMTYYMFQEGLQLGCTCIRSCSEIDANLEFIFHSGFSQMESSFCLP